MGHRRSSSPVHNHSVRIDMEDPLRATGGADANGGVVS